ncbi:MAG: Fe-S cluster assembly protein HesB, partial [Acidimicrobiia bacterium]|nr:Fe-S cluster assembly protein HesB [Acidimicrobiia bacterium]
DDQPRSVADMGSAEARLAVRSWKKAQKAAGKAKHE